MTFLQKQHDQQPNTRFVSEMRSVRAHMGKLQLRIKGLQEQRLRGHSSTSASDILSRVSANCSEDSSPPACAPVSASLKNFLLWAWIALRPVLEDQFPRWNSLWGLLDLMLRQFLESS